MNKSYLPSRVDFHVEINNSNHTGKVNKISPERNQRNFSLVQILIFHTSPTNLFNVFFFFSFYKLSNLPKRAFRFCKIVLLYFCLRKEHQKNRFIQKFKRLEEIKTNLSNMKIVENKQVFRFKYNLNSSIYSKIQKKS